MIEVEKGSVGYDEALKVLSAGIREALTDFFTCGPHGGEDKCMSCKRPRRVEIRGVTYDEFRVPRWRVTGWRWLDSEGWTRVSSEVSRSDGTHLHGVLCPECTERKLAP